MSTNITPNQANHKVVTINTPGPMGPQGPSGSASATGSLLATASFANPNIVFTKGDGSTFDVNLESLSADSEWYNGGTFLTSSKAVVITGSLTVSSSDTFINIGPGIFEGDLSSSGTISGSFIAGDGSQLTNLPLQSSLTASLVTTASVANDTITFTKGDGATFPIVIDNVSHSLEANDLVITVKNVSGGSLSAGTAVHAVGVTGENLEVVTASADDPNSMPAVAVLSETIENNAAGTAIISGRIIGINTSTLVAGSPVYVNNEGLLTATKPTGSSLIQNIGVCVKVNVSEGEVIIQGAGRANAVPNLLDNQIFFGTAGEVATQIHISGALDSTAINNVSASGNISSSGYVSASSFVGDGSQLTNLPLQSSLTASLIETASVSLNTITFTKGDGTTFPITVHTGSGVTSEWYDGGTFITSSKNVNITGSLTVNNVNADPDPSFILIADTGSNAAGPVIDLIRLPGLETVANGNYLGQIKFKGDSDTGVERVYAKISGKTSNVTNGSERGLIEFMVRDTSNKIAARLTHTDLKLINGTGLEADGAISASGGVTASGFLGDGSQLTNLQRPVCGSVEASMTASNNNAGFFFEVGGAVTCSIQAVATVPCAVGTEFEFFQTGSGNFLFETASGVTMYSKSGLKLNGEFAACTLKQIKTDTWVLIGDLTT